MGASCKSSDLSTGQFQDEYDTEKWNDYKVPDLVSARIGGTLLPAPSPPCRQEVHTWRPGAIISVVLGLLLVGSAVALWCFRRRRHARRGSQMTSEGKKSHIMRWMYADKPGIEDGPKLTGTTASSVVTATSPRTIEADSNLIYEMHDHSTAPPVELSTPFNNPSPSPTASDASSYGFVSPLLTTSAREFDSAPNRLAHH
ncbi:hypothetical protein EYZ11_012967 [Aspergillus tanneri]|uniref:Uncharacterized protein n=1 Tax=Aspergillus tanneri TaxID=1220188 RepID=A0A4S3IZ50_9EURO|nr:hypothetical protein EYZ11_012967 [Aspergillus tanneri]